MRAEITTDAINTETVTKTYARWAPVYDLVFGTVFERARNAAIAATNRVGGRVLDVGVGTGICLPHYAPSTRVVGIDLSEPMLRKARKRVAEQGLRHVECLEVMDAERLIFPEESFDVVVAQYVVNTVPHPEVALDEFARVLKPGGEIVLINRVGAEDGPRRTLEHLFMPVTQKLGWRSEFPWARFARWVEQSDGMRLIERRPVPPLGHFSLIRFGKVGTRADFDRVGAHAAG
ncbi:MAG: class I SAM-dependent methyltransferase [Sphingomonadales bacterium]|nr:class I SAM-dependent methyltransferase [Sphingomonadales bacterium]